MEIFKRKCEIKTKECYTLFLDEAKEKISLKDAPILACGMLSDIDYLISSDKEFLTVKSKKLKILSPKEVRKKLL